MMNCAVCALRRWLVGGSHAWWLVSLANARSSSFSRPLINPDNVLAFGHTAPLHTQDANCYPWSSIDHPLRPKDVPRGAARAHGITAKAGHSIRWTCCARWR